MKKKMIDGMIVSSLAIVVGFVIYYLGYADAIEMFRTHWPDFWYEGYLPSSAPVFIALGVFTGFVLMKWGYEMGVGANLGKDTLGIES